MHNMCHQTLRVAFQFCIADTQFLNQCGLHRLGIDLLTVNDFTQCLHDLGFHVVGRRIGEGDGKDVSEIAYRTFTGKT